MNDDIKLKMDEDTKIQIQLHKIEIEKARKKIKYHEDAILKFQIMRVGMTKEEFQEWKKSWFDRIPKCKDFACCHELMSCAIYPLCGCGSIYESYKIQKSPEECNTVGCIDCMLKYECDKIKIREILNKRKEISIIL